MCYTVGVFLTSENYIQYAQWPEEWQPLSTIQTVNIIIFDEEYFFPSTKKKNETMDFNI